MFLPLHPAIVSGRSEARLPLGINIAPDVFQEKMQTLFDDMSFTVKVYLDDLIIIMNALSATI